MRPWWISLLRAAILLTAIAVMLRGDVLYGLFCLVALGLALVPAALARSHHARAPVELELALLLLMVTDMTLGNLLGLYLRLPWFDKVLHLGTSILIGLIAFLAVYVLHVTGRIRFGVCPRSTGPSFRLPSAVPSSPPWRSFSVGERPHGLNR